jgi:hypothetical protein
MLLVELKKFTDPSYVFPVGAPDLFPVRIGQPSFGTNDIEPFYVHTVLLGAIGSLREASQ